MRKTVGIFLFDDVETLDFAGPLEVFGVADELFGFELYDTVTFAESTQPIRTIHGLSVNPKFSFETVPPVSILVVPGGEGIRKVCGDRSKIEFLQALAEHADIVMAVCSGALLAAEAGWLKEKPFCTHHLMYKPVQVIEPTAIPLQNTRFTGDGKTFSSGGVSAGIDLALHIVKLIHGAETSNETARYLEYIPTTSS